MDDKTPFNMASRSDGQFLFKYERSFFTDILSTPALPPLRSTCLSAFLRFTLSNMRSSKFVSTGCSEWFAKVLQLSLVKDSLNCSDGLLFTRSPSYLSYHLIPLGNRSGLQYKLLVGFRLNFVFSVCRLVSRRCHNISAIPYQLLIPTMPSADFCHTIRDDCSCLSRAISRKRLATAYGRSPGVRHVTFDSRSVGTDL